MPSLIATGKKIGVKINTAGAGSITQPTNNMMIIMPNRMIVGLSEKFRREAAIMLGNLAKANT